MKLSQLLTTLVSAVAFSLPFIFPQYCAWLVLFFWIPLVINRFRYGFIWGIVAYGLHFIWLLDLFIKKSNAHIWLAIILYAVIVIYAALSSMIWFFVTRAMIRATGYVVMVSMITTAVYFYLVDKIFWFFLPSYPFLNPLIPLMQYKAVCKLLFVPTIFFMPESSTVTLGENTFFYLAPAEGQYAHSCAHDLYRKIEKISSHIHIGKNAFLVGPETTFQFWLNKNEEFLKLWDRALPMDVSLLLGSIRLEEGAKVRRYQTVYLIKNGLIIKSYDKTNLVSFVEKLPKRYRKCEWVRDLFMKDLVSFSRGKVGQDNFKLCNSLWVRPVLCSELFLLDNINCKNADLIIAFVNDGWFCGYFRQLLKLLARVRIASYGVPLLYVGHQDA